MCTSSSWAIQTRSEISTWSSSQFTITQGVCISSGLPQLRQHPPIPVFSHLSLQFPRTSFQSSIWPFYSWQKKYTKNKLDVLFWKRLWLKWQVFWIVLCHKEQYTWKCWLLTHLVTMSTFQRDAQILLWEVCKKRKKNWDIWLESACAKTWSRWEKDKWDKCCKGVLLHVIIFPSRAALCWGSLFIKKKKKEWGRWTVKGLWRFLQDGFPSHSWMPHTSINHCMTHSWEVLGCWIWLWLYIFTSALSSAERLNAWTHRLP